MPSCRAVFLFAYFVSFFLVVMSCRVSSRVSYCFFVRIRVFVFPWLSCVLAGCLVVKCSCVINLCFVLVFRLVLACRWLSSRGYRLVVIVSVVCVVVWCEMARANTS